MLSSVQAALPLLAATARGALIWPVDVPFVAVATVEALLDGDPCRMLIPTHKGKGGHPLWLPKELFAETLALTPETGLRALRDRHPPVRVEVEDAEVLHDLDTPEALMQARSYWG